MPSETFSHSAVASASIDNVWAALEKPQTWESIGGIDKVVDSNIDPEGRLQGFSFDTMVAGHSLPGRGGLSWQRREPSYGLEHRELRNHWSDHGGSLRGEAEHRNRYDAPPSKARDCWRRCSSPLSPRRSGAVFLGRSMSSPPGSELVRAKHEICELGLFGLGFLGGELRGDFGGRLVVFGDLGTVGDEGPPDC